MATERNGETLTKFGGASGVISELVKLDQWNLPGGGQIYEVVVERSTGSDTHWRP